MTPRPVRQPRFELTEVSWLMRGPSRHVLECAIYHVDSGIEIRVGYGEDDLLRSQLVRELGAARIIAEEWRQAVLAKGGFEELSIPG